MMAAVKWWCYVGGANLVVVHWRWCSGGGCGMVVQ